MHEPHTHLIYTHTTQHIAAQSSHKHASSRVIFSKKMKIFHKPYIQNKSKLTLKAKEGPNRAARKLEPTQQEKHMRAATNPDFLSKQM